VDRYEKLVQRNVGSDLNRDEALQLAQQQELSLYSREYAVQDHPHRLKRLQAQQMKLKTLRDQAALDLARTRIVSPFDGRVTALDASPGNRVRPGDVIATVFDVSHMEVRAQIPSRYLNQVEKALQQKLEMDATLALEGERTPLRLERLAGAIDMGKGGVDGLFTIHDAERQLTLGRAGEVYLHMPPLENVIALPPTAIYGQQRIYKIEDGLLHTVMIDRLGEALQEDGERWQLVRADIADGDKILITQLPNAVGGLKVKLEEK
jgi:RND family efflux transporter MFP subunit